MRCFQQFVHAGCANFGVQFITAFSAMCCQQVRENSVKTSPRLRVLARELVRITVSTS